jgi:hypothetical protein
VSVRGKELGVVVGGMGVTDGANAVAVGSTGVGLGVCTGTQADTATVRSATAVATGKISDFIDPRILLSESGFWYETL